MKALPRLPHARRLSPWLPAAGLFLGAGVAMAQLVMPEWARPAPYGDERPQTVIFTLGGAKVDGDQARFQERTGLSGEAVGGIEKLTIFEELGEDLDRVLKVDFHGLFGLAEGELDLSYEKLEHWRVGLYVSHHQRYFDPEGGAAAELIPDLDLDPAALTMNFGTIRFTAERFSEEAPTLRLRYTRIWRNGERDSTVWGQIGAQRVGAASREINETRDTLEIEAEKRAETSRWRVTGRYSRTDGANTLHATNDPIVNPAEPVEQSEANESESVGAHGFYARTFFERLTVSVGGMFNRTDANVSGYRMVSNGSAFVDLRGESELSQHLYNGNLTMRWSPKVETVVAASVRGETLTAETTKNRNNPGDIVNSRDERDYFDFLTETRFTPNRLAGFYVLFGKTKGDGVLSETGNRISRITDSEENNHRIAAGLRLYPLSKVSLTGEAEHLAERTEFDHQRLDNFSSAYPGQISRLAEKADKFNLRLTVRPLSTVHLVTRADVAHRTIEPRFLSGNAGGQTDVDQLTLSQNVSISTSSKWYFQAGASYTENLHRTPISAGDGALAQILGESLNDHWSAHASVFVTLNDETDLQVTYAYFRADNDAGHADVTVPLEMTDEEHQLNAVLTRQFNDHLRGILRYGYYEGSDLRSADLNGYQAHVLYSSIHYRF